MVPVRLKRADPHRKSHHAVFQMRCSTTENCRHGHGLLRHPSPRGRSPRKSDFPRLVCRSRGRHLRPNLLDLSDILHRLCHCRFSVRPVYPHREITPTEPRNRHWSRSSLSDPPAQARSLVYNLPPPAIDGNRRQLTRNLHRRNALQPTRPHPTCKNHDRKRESIENPITGPLEIHLGRPLAITSQRCLNSGLLCESKAAAFRARSRFPASQS